MDQLMRDVMGRAAYAAFRAVKPDYPSWDNLDESCREANRAAAEAAYKTGMGIAASEQESEAE